MEHKMRMVETAKLVPYINNARTHSPAQIAKLRASIREFGFLNPVIIDGDCGIIAGHGRVLAAQEEGLEKVPCVLADHLTEAQKKAYILAETVWPWTRDGMRNFCGLRSKACRERTLTYP